MRGRARRFPLARRRSPDLRRVALERQRDQRIQDDLHKFFGAHWGKLVAVIVGWALVLTVAKVSYFEAFELTAVFLAVATVVLAVVTSPMSDLV